MDVGDEGGVGGDGAGEDLALLEEADFFYVAVEVVREHGDHAGDEGWAEEEASSERGFSMGTVLLPFSGEEVAVGLGGEGAGDGFAEAEGEEAGADGGFFRGCGVGDDGSGVGRVLAKRL